MERDVRQGDPLLSTLFTALLQKVFTNLNWEDKGIKINGNYLSNLRFADDIVLFTKYANTMQNMLN